MVPARLVGLKTQRAFLRALGVAAGLCGCGGSAEKEPAPQATPSAAPSAPAAPASEVFRGIVNIAANPVRIARCGAPDTLTVNDAGGKLAEARTHLGAPAQKATELFVIADAHKESGSTLRIDDVVYTSPEKFDCFTDWQAFEYRATGNNPGWVAEVLYGHIKLERQGAAPAEWNDARKDSSAQAIRITGAG